MFIKEKLKKISKEKIFIYAILLCVSMMFVYIASFSTSPRYRYYYGGDSAQFLTIGKAWAMGKIPYKEMFDHKGPIIFFINMLGYWITGTATGVMLIQGIFLSITLFAIYQIAQIGEQESFLLGMIAVFISLIVLTLCYVDGNLTEEYCLPFLAVSTYLQMNFFEKKDTVHSPKRAIFYGITFAVACLTRATNGITVCVGILIILLILIKNKNWGNILQNAVGFILGASIIILPFIIYFGVNDCISDFIYGTIGYNLEYKKHMQPWISNATGNDWINFLKLYFPSYVIFISTFLAIMRKRYIMGIYYVLCGILELYLFLNGALFAQYAIVTLPQIALLINEIVRIEGKEAENKLFQNILVAGLTFFCILSLREFIYKPADMKNTYQNMQMVGYENLLDEIPSDERNSFIAYGDNRIKELYLLHNLMPEYKYFVIQEWHAGFSEKVKNDIHDTFAKGKVKWILTAGNTDNINDTLQKDYKVFDSVDDFCLYERIR